MTLIDHTLFGTIDKVQIAIERFKEFEPEEGYYLAFSGGKGRLVVTGIRHQESSRRSKRRMFETCMQRFRF
jgi:3'-phosphoadenosine 5'-phosphosulfate sulfotransferase (PAPS reductase)/FAD synthetase